ncbi:MAG TPA: hypothetical protein VFB45_05555 [Pseudolabrys sp.]|nr:hypothetical protein [Pseudolabrys sp.]
MRRPHRNIEIFSMSVLDMFASALGAFIMVSVILFPYYKKDVSQELTETKKVLAEKSKELDTKLKQVREVEEKVRKQNQDVKQIRDTQANLNVCKQGLNQCQVEMGKNFLLVEIQWDKAINVDLHVTDPAGNEYYWRKTNRCLCDFPGEKARLSVDSFGSSRGGIEVWIAPDVKTGSYFVDYVIDRPTDEQVQVTGTVIDREGTHAIAPKALVRREPGQEARLRAAELRVAADGTLKIR